MAEANFDCLSKEAFSQNLSVDQITRPEDTMRAATGRPQGLRAANVSCDKGHLFRRIWPR